MTVEIMAGELSEEQKKIVQFIRRRTQNGLPTSSNDIGGHCGRAGFWCKKSEQCDFYEIPDRALIRRNMRKLEELGVI
ncbi:MAG: hypothetical protein JSV02_02025 [Dehalococcoidia bacterium]|nr:MAG: hypothetical protein JSV02_02025 [Dehalococcoidia bacterium]